MATRPPAVPHGPTPAVGCGYVAALFAHDEDMIAYYHSAFTDAELVQVLSLAAMSYIEAIVTITGQPAADLADLFVAASTRLSGHSH